MRLEAKFVILLAVVLMFIDCGCADIKIKKCGIQRAATMPSVFGSEKVEKDKHEFPWLAALHHRSKRTFFCSGSLISEKHILSGKTQLDDSS